MTFGTGILRSGSTDAGVTELQQWLIDRSFLIPHPAPSGTFDDVTSHAVRPFQFSAGIGVDGVVGDGTRTAADGFAGTALTTRPITTLTSNQVVSRNAASATAGPPKYLSELKALALTSRMLRCFALTDTFAFLMFNKTPKKPRPNAAPQHKMANVEITTRADRHSHIWPEVRELLREAEMP